MTTHQFNIILCDRTAITSWLFPCDCEVRAGGGDLTQQSKHARAQSNSLRLLPRHGCHISESFLKYVWCKCGMKHLVICHSSYAQNITCVTDNRKRFYELIRNFGRFLKLYSNFFYREEHLPFPLALYNSYSSFVILGQFYCSLYNISVIDRVQV